MWLGGRDWGKIIRWWWWWWGWGFEVVCFLKGGGCGEEWDELSDVGG